MDINFAMVAGTYNGANAAFVRQHLPYKRTKVNNDPDKESQRCNVAT